jgi:hypothetical protein
MAKRAYCAQKGAPSLPKNQCGHIPSGVRELLHTPCDRCVVLVRRSRTLRRPPWGTCPKTYEYRSKPVSVPKAFDMSLFCDYGGLLGSRRLEPTSGFLPAEGAVCVVHRKGLQCAEAATLILPFRYSLAREVAA